MREQLKKGFRSGLQKGWSGFLWVLKILIPVSLLTSLLEWSGLIAYLDSFLGPAMHWLGLPSMAAFPLLIGVFTGPYGTIGSMAVLPLTREEMTLIAIFILIAHNLIQEGAIQGKSGLHPLKATLFRLGTAVITVALVAQLLGTSPERSEALQLAGHVTPPFISMARSWALSTLNLTIRVFFILMVIVTLVEILKVVGWIDPAVRFLSPFLRFLGLSPRVGFLWITGAVFGLAFGAAIILKEVEEGNLEKEELEGLHLSIGINHSVIEDPALFMAIGLSPFWLYIPRLIMAVLVVRLYGLWQSYSRKKQSAKPL